MEGYPASRSIDASKNTHNSVTRGLVLATALVFTIFFAILTASVIIKQGLTIAGLLAIVIIVMFALGIIGALRNPPPK